MISNPLASALELAESGIPVFPCILNGTPKDKSPTTPHGFKDASFDPEAVRALWRNYPGKLVGVPTGAIAGFDVVDIDPRHGGDKWLDAHRRRLPPTRTHATRSGGFHLLFRHHPGMGCSANRIAPGVDVRADGGYVIWWPAAGGPVSDGSIMAEWPEWLVDCALPAPWPPQRPDRPVIELTGTRMERYALGALRKAADTVASTTEGQRNIALNINTWSLTKRFVDVLGPQRIADTMAAAGMAAGLDQRSVARTIASALRAGGVH